MLEEVLTVAAESLARRVVPSTPIGWAPLRWKVNRFGWDPTAAVKTSLPFGWSLLNYFY
jgi:hypothetical protein